MCLLCVCGCVKKSAAPAGIPSTLLYIIPRPLLTTVDVRATPDREHGVPTHIYIKGQDTHAVIETSQKNQKAYKY